MRAAERQPSAPLTTLRAVRTVRFAVLVAAPTAPLAVRAVRLAVFVATINNFTWNRLWTWHDRREHVRTPVMLQFAQYGVACWLGILLQFVITKLLVGHVHYLVANVVAIVIASVANFVVNDNWTFGRLRLLLRRARQHAHAHDKAADPPRD